MSRPIPAQRVPANCVQGPILTERGFTVVTFAASVATFAVLFAATHKPITVRTVVIERQATIETTQAPMPATVATDDRDAAIRADMLANEEAARAVLSGQSADYFQPDSLAGPSKAKGGPRKVFGRIVKPKP